jgi:hypothetical protein
MRIRPNTPEILLFAPDTRLRAAITPARRGAGGKGAKQDAEAPAVPKHVAMNCARGWSFQTTCPEVPSLTRFAGKACPDPPFPALQHGSRGPDSLIST